MAKVRLTVTAPQLKALERLASKEGGSAYTLRLSMSTLNSLKAKGYATSNTSGLGALFSPRTGVTWYITDSGRAVYRSAQIAKAGG